MIRQFGLSGVFFSASIFCGVGTAFSLRFIPAIKNKSVTELEDLYKKESSEEEKPQSREDNTVKEKGEGLGGMSIAYIMSYIRESIVADHPDNIGKTDHPDYPDHPYPCVVLSVNNNLSEQHSTEEEMEVN